MTTFRIGSGYENDEDYFGNGKIDEFKIHMWLMSEQNIEDTYYAYNFSPYFEKRGKCYSSDIAGQIAGAQDQVREFKFGKLIKTPDSKVYVITRDEKKLYIENLAALSKFGTHPIVEATYQEANRYRTEGTFDSKTKYPDATLLKGSDNTIYWIWDGEKRAIANEYVFNRYGNSWSDVITVTDSELKKYATGFVYYQ
jgi:hypothetical protein